LLDSKSPKFNGILQEWMHHLTSNFIYWHDFWYDRILITFGIDTICRFFLIIYSAVFSDLHLK
jgi:hypothetical protein